MRTLLRVSLAAGLAVLMGWLGVVSDHVPFGAVSHELIPQLGWGVAGFANDIVTWFVVVMVIARALTSTWLAAAVTGSTWAGFTISLYLALGGDGGWYPAAVVNWVMPAVAAGAIAGLAGHATSSRGWLWAGVPLLVLGRLVMNGTSAWQSTVGLTHSLLLVALGVGTLLTAVRSSVVRTTAPR